MKKKFVMLSLCFLIVGFLSFSLAQVNVPSSSGSGGSDLENGNTLEDGAGTNQGAVITKTKLATENALEESELQNRVGVKAQVKAGNYELASGKKLMVQTTSENKLELKSGNVIAKSGLKIDSQDNGSGMKLSTTLSNGKNAEVKVMPDTASERALERLRLKVCSEENGCVIELKEVGSGEKTKLAYELKTQRESKVFGLFKAQMKVQAQVNAEDGEVISVKKPWWAFLATEPKE